MPNLTVSVPANAVATLVAAGAELLDARGIDHTGWTPTQVGQRYLAEILKDVYVQRTANTAQATAQATVDAARTQAATDATGITG